MFFWIVMYDFSRTFIKNYATNSYCFFKIIPKNYLSILNIIIKVINQIFFKIH